jgi:hypothetical protein
MLPVPIGVALALVIIIALVVLMSTRKPGPDVADGRFAAEDEREPDKGTEVEESEAERK